MNFRFPYNTQIMLTKRTSQPKPPSQQSPTQNNSNYIMVSKSALGWYRGAVFAYIFLILVPTQVIYEVKELAQELLILLLK